MPSQSWKCRQSEEVGDRLDPAQAVISRGRASFAATRPSSKRAENCSIVLTALIWFRMNAEGEIDEHLADDPAHEATKPCTTKS
jgi:hypothetical protein